jgi:hypothetical protein
MKVWISKYALTKTGIYETEGECSKHDPKYFFSKNNLNGFGPKEWHLTKEDAIDAAEVMRFKKISMYQKKVESLKKLEFK